MALREQFRHWFDADRVTFMSSKEQTRERQRMAAEAVRSVEPTATDAWDTLSSLSTETTVDSVEVFEDEILLEDDTFLGSLLWHVTLAYRDADGEITLTESFPGTFRGIFQDDRAKVEQITADTSGFFQ